VNILSTVSIVDKNTAWLTLEDVASGGGCVGLDLTGTPAQRADLDAAQRDFPEYRSEVEPLPGRRRYIARRT
jgi:hypothetical protein